ncbi:hypothetical protein DAPPUDRAFT_260163 [Daphnia pulex]|uniref:Uncharacterized protein n=1 Tax=Daphnia pulex TaxID=6669 RepID=E9HIM4_DAPPU|nr:hypothetical protein DAPPUDRAFT_260163 [Daphnia pulex]|eukprot:EFX68382.1 hypothetical protein DAPPUDRAFT_260163 [Daphnia pulex]
MRSRFIRQPGQESFRLVRLSQRNHDNCAAATQPLIKVVDNLCTLTNSPDFASILVKISPTAHQYQKPYTSVAKSLALNPKDPPTVCHIFVKDVESAFMHWGFTTPGFPLFETI